MFMRDELGASLEYDGRGEDKAEKMADHEHTSLF